MQRRELLVDGQVQVDVLVDGIGPAIVVLPSSQRDSLDFDDVAGRTAAAGFSVLRPQPRGMANSKGPMQGLTLDALAQDVALVIERLGGGRAIVAGHAFGHFVARVAALNHPALVRGVAVLAGAARTFPPGLTAALDVAADASRPRDERLSALQRAFFAPGNDASVWLDGWHPALRETYRAAAVTPPKTAWWPVSHAPILDLQGACDPWRPAATRLELQEVLGAKVTVQLLEQASHAMLPEQPAAVAAALTAWARTLPT
ncbi:alpha/beta hydrolase [Sphaerotilus sp.]|uniref:alpha/beta fold hydrolase n=1 Tax=Sphaerotilus sp. TaxID=2093942 RepID=UPI00286DE8C0|nr:alpha/beta hydrolase [Sphaerotilus sp.]